jgi:hypothetical protein
MENMHLDLLQHQPEYCHLSLETTPINIMFDGQLYTLSLDNLKTDPHDSTLRLCFPSGMQCSVQLIKKLNVQTKWRAVYGDFKKTRLFITEEESGDQLILNDSFFTLFVGACALHSWHFLFTYTGAVFRWRDIENLKPVLLQPGYGNGYIAEDENTRVFMQSQLRDFCNAFFDRRKESNYHMAPNNSIVLDYMPQNMSSCTLVPGEWPKMIRTVGGVDYEGERRFAEAIIEYKDRGEERMVLRSTTMVLNLFEKWIGVPFYDRDAWLNKENIETALRIKREEDERLERERAEEAAKAAAERARIAKEESVRREAEEARKLTERAATERANPQLTIDSMRKCILDFFESVKATYPGFKPSMVRVGRDFFTPALHIECTVDLNPGCNVISPIYPNAREIYITNRFYWPADMNGVKPNDDPVRFIMRPEGKDIINLLGIRPLDRVSDITQCLKHVFPENGDAQRILTEKQAEQQAQERIQARRAESKGRVESAMSALADKLIRELENEMRRANVTITNAEGADVNMSLYEACQSLDVRARTFVTDALSQQRGLRSAIAKVSETLNRIALHT